MRLYLDLPHFVPICGNMIRLYYCGIPKMCTKCFGAHIRKDCTFTEVQWVKYIKMLMVNRERIPMEFYGKGATLINEQESANTPAMTQSNPTQNAAYGQSQLDLCDKNVRISSLYHQLFHPINRN
jgi:hypothetical protein